MSASIVMLDGESVLRIFFDSNSGLSNSLKFAFFTSALRSIKNYQRSAKNIERLDHPIKRNCGVFRYDAHHVIPAQKIDAVGNESESR